MEGRTMRSIALAAWLAVGVLMVLPSPAFAAEPLRQTFTGTVTAEDYFSGSDLNERCAFPVLGQWDFVNQQTTFFDEATGNPVRAVSDIYFNGTFSNPLNGKSVPDSSHHLKITDYLAADGSLIEEVINETRDDPYLHSAFHAGTDAQFNILFDNGRDWLFTATRFISIAPLCAALS
jgi:hypothetical protein